MHYSRHIMISGYLLLINFFVTHLPVRAEPTVDQFGNLKRMEIRGLHFKEILCGRRLCRRFT